MFVERRSEDERRKEAWNKLKVNVKEIEKPRNVLLLGCYGTGKSSFINTAIAALTGRYKFYADVGHGNQPSSTRLHKIPCKGYWNPSNEEDKTLNLPNFIDTIGLDVQLSSPENVGSVNSQMINLIINGTLPENCDLLDLGKKLKKEMKMKNSPEVESLAIDMIVVVISLKDDNIPHTLLEEIYTEANIRTRQIPVFSVLTKKGECNLSQKGLEKKKIDIAEALIIDVDNILICENYQPNQKLDSRDCEIFEFLTKICDPRYKAKKLQRIEFEMNQTTSPETDTPATTSPTSPTKNRSFMLDKSLEDEKRKEVWNELKANLKEIEKPRNVLFLGGIATGKSSFINTVITALTGKYRYYADIGCGNKHNSIRLHKISSQEYWNPKNEEDKILNLPNFIDIIGLDVQLSGQEEVGSVNSQMMNLIFNGKLPENCDLLDLGNNLKKGNRITESSEDESLAIDIIVVVISSEDYNIPHALLEEIYVEANVRARKIPVFFVLTKMDKCDQSQKVLDKKRKEITEALNIDAYKLLICDNYQPNQKPDSRDIRILEFLTKVAEGFDRSINWLELDLVDFSHLCDPCFKAVKLQKVEFEEQTPAHDPDASTSTPISPSHDSFIIFLVLVLSILTVLILSSYYPK